MRDARVLGVDACRAGWIGVVPPAGPRDEGAARAYFAPRVADLVALADADGEVAVVAVDMPIGLPDPYPDSDDPQGRTRRRADVLARAELGPRWRSVFMTPVRAALEADDYASAVAVNRRLAGEGVSRQAFGLKEKLLEVERWVREAGRRVVEVHPELSFARLAGAPLPHPKTTWAGAERRRELLAAAGVVLAGDLGRAGAMAGVDDVLDAGAAAWTALRVVSGDARPLPDPPEVFSDGIPCAIWA
ncbi:UNVERIFIED_ORG: putative RNase H-like nuclease [Microbispora rosea subsp. rosea]